MKARLQMFHAGVICNFVVINNLPWHSFAQYLPLPPPKNLNSKLFPLFSDGPKNTSVLVRSSSEMGAGSSIVLICCSDALPPVENYRWFKIVDGWIEKVGHQAELLPVHGGQYLCSVSNKHGSQNSTVFTLKKNCKYLTKVVAFYELVFGKCIKKFIRFCFLALLYIYIYNILSITDKL